MAFKKKPKSGLDMLKAAAQQMGNPQQPMMAKKKRAKKAKAADNDADDVKGARKGKKAATRPTKAGLKYSSLGAKKGKKGAGK